MFHVGAIIELIENDDLMNEEEEEEVKFNKLSVVFHQERKREREKKKHIIIIAVKNLIDPVCPKTRDDRGALPSTEKKI